MADLNAWKTEQAYDDMPCDVLVIGEPVYLLSMKAFLQQEMGLSDVRLLCLWPMRRGGSWNRSKWPVWKTLSVRNVVKPAGSLPTRFMPGSCRTKRKNSFPCPMKPIPAVITTLTCQSSSGRPLRHG